MALHPEIQHINDATVAARPPAGTRVPVAEMRANSEAESERWANPGPEVAEVADRTIPGPAGDIGLRVYRPTGPGPFGVVASFHGGGWVVGSLDSHDAPNRALAVASGAIVVAVDYRLAPEHPYPAAVQDAIAVVRWLGSHADEVGGDPARLAVSGDSAGGTLATVAAMAVRGAVPLRHQSLIYPVTDHAMDAPSWQEFATGLILTATSMSAYWDMYLDGDDGMAPDASPLRADDLSGLPPAYVLTCEQDVLRDEGEAYAEAMRAAGVDVTLVRAPGTTHGFWRWQATAALARDAVAAAGAAIAAALA